MRADPAMRSSGRLLTQRGAMIELDSVRALGIFGGAFYFISLFMLILSTFQSDPTPGSKLYLYRVLVIIAFIQIPLGAVHIAEVGVLNWIMLATALTFTASRVRMAS